MLRLFELLFYLKTPFKLLSPALLFDVIFVFLSGLQKSPFHLTIFQEKNKVLWVAHLKETGTILLHKAITAVNSCSELPFERIFQP